MAVTSTSGTSSDGIFNGYSVLVFNGSSTLTTSHASDYNYSTDSDFTIDAWVKTTTTTANMAIWSKAASTYASKDFYLCSLGSTGVALHIYDISTSAAAITSSTNIADGEWHHITVMRSSSGTNDGTHLMVDGAITSITTSWDATNSNSFVWGDESVNDIKFTGNMADLRVSGRAQHAQTANTVTTQDANWDDVELLLDFNGDIVDESSNSHTFVATGEAAGTPLSSSIYKWGSGSLDQIDGYPGSVSQSLRWEHGQNWNSSSVWTVEMWFYHTDNLHTSYSNRAGLFGLGGWYAILALYENSGNNNLFWGYTHPSGGHLDTGMFHTTSSGNSVISPNTWHHVALCADSTGCRLYLNGVESTTDSVWGGINTAHLNSGEKFMGIGNCATTYDIAVSPVKAYIDDFRVTWGVARYTADFSPPTGAFGESMVTTVHSYTQPTTPFGSGVFSAAIPAVDAKFGNGAAKFDGDGDFLTVASNAKFDLGAGDYTAEAWVKPDDLTDTVGTETTTSTPTPNWDETVFLLQSNTTTDASTTFTGTGLGDHSTTPHTLTATGDTKHATAGAKSGFWDSSVKFDGTGDDLVITDTMSDFTFASDPFTIEFWLYRDPSSSSSISYLFDWRTSGDPYVPVMYMHSDQQIDYYSSGATRISSSLLSLGAWYHIAVVRDSSDITTLYVNGKSHGTWTNSSAFIATTAITMGNFNGGSYPLNGYINDFRVTKGVALYSGTNTSTEWSNFDEITTKFPIVASTASTTTTYNHRTANPIMTIGDKLQLTSHTDGTSRVIVDGTERVVGTTVMDTSTWRHAAVSRKDGNTRLFIDGTQEGSTYVGTDDVGQGEVRIGHNLIPGSTIPGTGLLGNATLSTGLISYYKMDNAWTDSTSNAFTGTATNAIFSSTNKLGTHSGSFDGSGDKVKLPTGIVAELNGSAGVSCSVWVKGSSLSGTIFEFTHNGTNALYDFNISTTFQIGGRSGSSDSWSGYTPGGTPSTSDWTHAVAVIDYANDSMTLYMNGSQVATSSETFGNTTLANAGDYVHLGAGQNGTNDSFNGLMDEVGIWGKALTSAEVTALYNSGDGLVYPGTAATGVPADNQYFQGYMDEMRITKGQGRYTTNFTPLTREFAHVLPQTTGDEHYESVSLSLHMDGANNSTTFTDTSDTGHTVTAVGNTHIQTYVAAIPQTGGVTTTSTSTVESTDTHWDNVSIIIRGDETITGTTFTAASGSTPAGHSITLTGGMTSGTGKWSDGGYVLDGVDDYMTIAAHADFDFGDDWTIEAWLKSEVNTHASDGFNYRGSWWAAGTINVDNFIAYPPYEDSSGTMSAAGNIPGPDMWVSPITGFDPDEWCHFAYVNNSTELRLYINGKYYANRTHTYDLGDSDTDILIGILHADALSTWGINQRWFKGTISDLRVTKGVERYTGTSTTDWSNFSEITEAFSVTGEVTTSTTSAIVPAVPAKDPKFGSGMGEFDGTGDYLTIPTSSDFALGTGDYTIEGWVKGNTTSSEVSTTTTTTSTDSEWANVKLLITGSETISGGTFTSSGTDIGHTVTVHGGLTKTDGKYGQGFLFDNLTTPGHRLSIQAHADWALSTPNTVEMWVKLNATNNPRGMIMSHMDTSDMDWSGEANTAPYWIIERYPGAAANIWGSGTWGSMYPGANFTWDTDWHHVAVVTLAGTSKYYVDGIYVATTSNSITTLGSADYGFIIGHGWQNTTGSSANYWFNGIIDSIRITEAARYTGTSTSEWGNFDEPSAEWSYSSTTTTTTEVLSKMGGGLIRFGDTSANNPLLKLETTGATAALASTIAKYDIAATTQITGTTSVDDNLWHHVAVSRTGTSTKLFVDGVQEGSTFVAATNLVDSGLMIGASPGSSTSSTSDAYTPTTTPPAWAKVVFASNCDLDPVSDANAIVGSGTATVSYPAFNGTAPSFSATQTSFSSDGAIYVPGNLGGIKVSGLPSMANTENFTIECLHYPTAHADGTMIPIIQIHNGDYIASDITVWTFVCGLFINSGTQEFSGSYSHWYTAGGALADNAGFPSGNGPFYTLNEWNYMCLERYGQQLRVSLGPLSGTMQTATTNVQTSSTAMRAATTIYFGTDTGLGWGSYQGYIDSIRYTRDEAVYGGNTPTFPTAQFDIARPAITTTTTVAEDAYYGYMDDVRITKGVGRYTANFVVPQVANYDAIGDAPSVTGDSIYFNTGRVGIGTSTPAYALDVAGGINVTGNLYKAGVEKALGTTTVSLYADLPTASAKPGDFYLVSSSNKMYWSNGSSWVAVGSAIPSWTTYVATAGQTYTTDMGTLDYHDGSDGNVTHIVGATGVAGSGTAMATSTFLATDPASDVIIYDIESVEVTTVGNDDVTNSAGTISPKPTWISVDSDGKLSITPDHTYKSDTLNIVGTASDGVNTLTKNFGFSLRGDQEQNWDKHAFIFNFQNNFDEEKGATITGGSGVGTGYVTYSTSIKPNANYTHSVYVNRNPAGSWPNTTSNGNVRRLSLIGATTPWTFEFYIYYAAESAWATNYPRVFDADNAGEGGGGTSNYTCWKYNQYSDKFGMWASDASGSYELGLENGSSYWSTSTSSSGAATGWNHFCWMYDGTDS